MFGKLNPMPREIFEIRGLSRVEPYIRRLVKETSLLTPPVLLISVGQYSNKVEQVLSMAADCKCKLSVRMLLHASVREKVLKALNHTGNIEIQDEIIIREGDIPSFLVSEAGYYVQDGLNFDEAVLSFSNTRIRNFLVGIFEDRVGQNRAA